MKKFFQRMKKNAGFTLTELIVVVAILGVLAAIATPSVMGYIDEARTSTDEANKVTLNNIVKRLAARGATNTTTGIVLGTTTVANIQKRVASEYSGVAVASATTADLPAMKVTSPTKYFVLTTSTGNVAISETAADGQVGGTINLTYAAVTT
jgi:prepilin-type N-terminal cleavage/methylation domain-containing protein